MGLQSVLILKRLSEIWIGVVLIPTLAWGRIDIYSIFYLADPERSLSVSPVNSLLK